MERGDELERRTRARLAALGFAERDAAVLADHFLAAERSGRSGHGLARVDWLEGWSELEPAARPRRVVSEPGYERWDGNGALGYLVLHAIVSAQLDSPPASARVVVAGRTFPTGVLGQWTRRLAEGGLVAAATATSPRRLGPPGGGPRLAGTNPLSLAIPSSDGRPVVADVSMGNLTYGDVLTGRAREEELAPFGGAQAHKAFALALGLQLLVDALTPDEGFGALLLVAAPQADPVPELRRLARGARLPGDGGPGAARLATPEPVRAPHVHTGAPRRLPESGSLNERADSDDGGVPPRARERMRPELVELLADVRACELAAEFRERLERIHATHLGPAAAEHANVEARERANRAFEALTTEAPSRHHELERLAELLGL